MNNETIIYRASVELARAGVITAQTIGGMLIPEPLHTFAEWKNYGFCVKKGQHAVVKIKIWRHSDRVRAVDTDGETDGETDGGRFYLTNAYFFTRSQCDPIESHEGETYDEKADLLRLLEAARAARKEA